MPELPESPVVDVPNARRCRVHRQYCVFPTVDAEILQNGLAGASINIVIPNATNSAVKMPGEPASV